MKRKEFLQKSAVIAAVTLAAAVMEPGMVRAAEISDQEVSAPVLDQSLEDTSANDVSEIADEQISDETADSKSDAMWETNSIANEDSADSETTEDTTSDDNQAVSDAETTIDISKVSGSEISSSSESSDVEADDPNAETSKTDGETAAQLQTPEWTTREDGTTGYQNEDGSLCADTIKEVDGKLYYFNAEGALVKDDVFQYDSNYYKASEDGSLYRSCWDGDSYYNQEGKQQRDCITEINGISYCFGNGELYKNELFYMKNPSTGDFCCFCADKDGHLIINDWGSGSYSDYYFGEDGACCKDEIKEIDGKFYYFNWWDGALLKNYSFSRDGYHYKTSADGSLYQSCWNDDSYYDQDGKQIRDCITNINGKYYCFDYNGKTHKNELFRTENPFTHDYCYFYATEDGHLITNSWGTGDYADCYFGEDGARCENVIKEIDGKLYYFDSDGKLFKDTTFKYGGYYDSYYYKASADGSLYQSCWDGDSYYDQEGKQQRNIVIEIGDAYYGFSEDGHLYVDTIFDITDDEGWKIVGTYLADKNGKVRTDCTANTWNTDYYFDTDGKGYDGMKTVQNVKYYYSDGELRKNIAFTYDEVNYVSGADGRVLVLPQNGWIQVDGLWYYVSNGTIIQNQKFDIDGKTYLFHRNGYMLTNAILSNSQGVYAAADKNGILVKDGWVKRPRTGGWMYFDSNGSYVGIGIQTIHGKKYYFSYNRVRPELVTNQIVKAENETYIADNNGVLHAVNANGWNKFGDYWYYFVNGTEVSDEIIKIGNAYYGFDSQGHMYDDTDFYYSDDNVYGRFRAAAGGALIFQDTVTIDGVSYTYDENGVGLKDYHTVNGTSYYFIGGQKAVNRAFFDGSRYCAADASGKLYSLANDTWTKVGSYYYYVKDNEILKDTMLSIGGKYYAFDSYGRMLTNQFYYSTYRNDNPDEIIFGMVGDYTLDPIRYRASASGAFLCNEWYEDETGKYYFDGNGIGYEGTHWIDGKRYTFSQGKVIAESAPVSKPSWEKDSKGWWYRHADGSYAKNGWKKINGKYYLFNASGYMLTGWQNVKGTWYYMNANGDMTSKAWQKLNGKWYYFNADGSMTSNTWQKLNNKWYYFNADGVMITKSWRQIAGKWYYFEADGSMAGKGWHQLNGKWYYMYDSGIMATNTWIGNSYVDANGVWTKSK